MIGNNSCGVHSVMAGKTDDNIEALEVLTYDGVRMKVGATSSERTRAHQRKLGGGAAKSTAGLQNIAATYGDLVRQRFPNIPRRVSGYNLNYLLPENGFHVARALVGSEGTCVTVLEATCRLVESPPERVLLVVAYPDIYQCADHVPEIMTHKPIGLEGFDDLLVGYTRMKGINSEGLALLPEGGGWLMVEFGAETAREAESQARGLMQTLARSANPPNMRLYTEKQQVKRVWEVRESSLGVTSHVPGEATELGRLGRRRRRARKTRRLSPRSAQDDGRLRLQRLALRPLRPRLRAHPHQFRSAIERGHRQVPQVYGGSCRSRGQLRRIDLRRARRRPIPRRAAAENVRPGTGPGFPRVQVGLGSGMEDESRQTDRALQARRKPAPGRGLRSLGTENAISSFPPTTAAWPRPRCAAWAWASAAAKKAA